MLVQYKEAVVLLGDMVEGVATDTAQPKTMVEATVRPRSPGSNEPSASGRR
jgi:hypothetical protein